MKKLIMVAVMTVTGLSAESNLCKGAKAYLKTMGDFDDNRVVQVYDVLGNPASVKQFDTSRYGRRNDKLHKLHISDLQHHYTKYAPLGSNDLIMALKKQREYFKIEVELLEARNEVCDEKTALVYFARDDLAVFDKIFYDFKEAKRLKVIDKKERVKNAQKKVRLGKEKADNLALFKKYLREQK